MNIKFLLSIALLSSAVSANAQTSLAAGDISIIGFNTNLPNRDGHAFVCWVPLLANTTIYFTDEGFNGTGSANAAGNFRHGESTITWNTALPIAAGTVITIEGNGTTPNVVANLGTVSVINADGTAAVALALGNGGEQIFAFQGTALGAPANGTATFPGTLLCGVGCQGVGANTGWLTTGSSSPSASYLPTQVTSYAPYFAGSAVGGEYTGIRVGLTMAQFKTAVNNPANWTTTTSGVTAYNTTAFTNTPLNVSLSSFTAKNEQGIAGLYWKTESEMENAGFAIERSNDGKVYQAIGFVATKAVDGNSSTTLTYNFQDRNPSTGINFYRLAQKDISEKITYSAAVSLNFDKPADFICYPNPVQGQMTLRYNLDRQQNMNISMTDITGKVVLLRAVNAAKGLNHAVIDMSGLSQGLYNLSVTSNAGVLYTTRISKN